MSIVIAPGQAEYVCFAAGKDALGEPHSLTKMILEAAPNDTNPTIRQMYRPELTVRFSDISGHNEWRARITYRFSGSTNDLSGWELEVTGAEIRTIREPWTDGWETSRAST